MKALFTVDDFPPLQPVKPRLVTEKKGESKKVVKVIDQKTLLDKVEPLGTHPNPDGWQRKHLKRVPIDQKALLKQVETLAKKTSICFKHASTDLWDDGRQINIELKLIPWKEFEAKQAEIQTLQEKAEAAWRAARVALHKEDKKYDELKLTACKTENAFLSKAKAFSHFGAARMGMDGLDREIFEDQNEFVLSEFDPIVVGVMFGKVIRFSSDDFDSAEDYCSMNVHYQQMFHHECVLHWSDFEKIRSEKWMTVFHPNYDVERGLFD